MTPLEKRVKMYRKASPSRLQKLMEGFLVSRQGVLKKLSAVQDEERKLSTEVDKFTAQERKLQAKKDQLMAKVRAVQDKREVLEAKLEDLQDEAELIGMMYEEAVSDE